MSTAVSTTLDFSSGARITGLLAAIAAGQPVTFEQLSSAIEGLKFKASARVSTQGNINLAAPGATIDGITMALNDRFFVPAQTAQSENGLYVWNGAAVAAVRSFDAQTFTDLEAAVVTVEEGTSAGQTFRQTQVNAVIGTGNVIWTSFGATVGPASNVSSGIVRLATSAETIAGTDNTIAVTPADLAAYSGFSKKYAAAFGDGSALSYTITHNLNTRDVEVTVRRAVAPFDEIIVDNAATTVNTVTIVFTGTAPTTNQFRAVVVG